MSNITQANYLDVMASVRASQDTAERHGRLIMAQQVLSWATRYTNVIPDAPFLELVALVTAEGARKGEDDA